jgi:hypothetical protein
VPPALPSYASGTSDVPLLGDTVGDGLDRTAARIPDNEALVEVATGRRWTYAQFVEGIDALACGLLGAGVRTGDRVGIWAPNVAEWVFVQYATAKIGAILVNINPGLPHARAGVRAEPGRDLAAGRRAELQDLRLRGDGRGGPPAVPGPAAGGADRLGRVDGPGVGGG